MFIKKKISGGGAEAIWYQFKLAAPIRQPTIHQALLPSARYERRVGVSLVRAAWERRPEGPAYLLSSVTLLYLAGLCAF